MMSYYTRCVRPFLFRLDPERAHHLTVGACRLAGALSPLRAAAGRCLTFDNAALRSVVAAIEFANPIGLAAGWDKSGRALAMLGHMGFGHAEIGSVSAEPSAGNPRPRLFRLPRDRAIVVHYGVPNDGASAVADRLDALGPRCMPIGVNLVATNRGLAGPELTDQEIVADYGRSVERMHRRCDYLMLNLSCPNAKDGRDFFSEPANIARLLERLAPLKIAIPVFLKIAPVDDPAWLARIVEIADRYAFVRGFSFNLPTGKPEANLLTPRSVWQQWPGAVSGKPVAAHINRCIGELYRLLPRERFVIIGAGGVFTADDAYEKIKLGASLVQLYTALVYEGPTLAKRINAGLCRLLERDGFRNVRDAVGIAVR
ncbi:MAG TPA: quinone-dependent dihydroorotate dehydrogenase [Pirellulales bacterium]|nr:quinone-dependent dihydroorotate dehydrogenase [Pirellulales bacterium]